MKTQPEMTRCGSTVSPNRILILDILMVYVGQALPATRIQNYWPSDRNHPNLCGGIPPGTS